MSLIGAILLVTGAVNGLLLYTGNAPQALVNLGLSDLMWLGVSVVGALVMYFNKRAAD